MINFSNHSEKEIILSRDSKFRIEDIDHENKNIFMTHLENQLNESINKTYKIESSEHKFYW